MEFQNYNDRGERTHRALKPVPGEGFLQNRYSHHAAACVAAGWGLLAVWADLYGHMPAFAIPYSELAPFGNMRIFWLTGLLAMSCIMVAFPQRVKQHAGALQFAAPFIASFSTLAFAASFQQSVLPPQALALTGIVASGAFYTWFACSFCLVIARTTSLRAAIATVAGSLIIKIFVFHALSLLASDSAATVVAIALPFVVAALLKAAESLGRKNAEQPNAALADSAEAHAANVTAQKGPWAGIISPTSEGDWPFPQVAIAAVALATMRAITPLGFFGDPLNLFTNIPVSLLGALGVCVITGALSAILFANKRLGEKSADFLPGFLVLIFAFFASAGISPSNAVTAAILEMFITAAEAFGHVLFWSILVVFIRRGGVATYRFLGCATGIYNVISLIWITFFFDLGIANNAVILCVVFAILTLVVWLADRRGVQQPQQAAADAGSELVDRREELANRYALSPREREVFMMLAQGRSRAHISNALVLSEGTVKTHISHIYAKLGVSNKQEMLDLLLANEENGEDRAAQPKDGDR